MEKQIFFLLTVTGLLASICLLSRHIETKLPALSPFSKLLNTRLIKSLLAVVLFIISIMGFIFPGEQMPFWGDFLPLFSSILASIMMAYEVYQEAHPNTVVQKVEKIFIKNRTLIATSELCLITVHFFAESLILL